MSMVFTSTTVIEIISTLLWGGSLIASTVLLFNNIITPIQFVIIGIVIIIIDQAVHIAVKMKAVKKYNKSLAKMDYDLHGFFNEQQKFLQRPFIGKKTKNLIKSNIAVAYIYNEQFIDALNLYKSIEREIYNESITSKFVSFINIMVIYAHIGDLPSSDIYCNNATMVLRELKEKYSSVKPLEINIYDVQLKLCIAERNFIFNRNPQTAKELFDLIQLCFKLRKENGFKVNQTLSYYDMGVALAVMGDDTNSKEYFDYVIKNGGDLPCVNRSKQYLATGDTSILKI